MFRDDLAPAKLSKYPCDPIGRASRLRLFKIYHFGSQPVSAALIGLTHARGYSRANLPQILTVGSMCSGAPNRVLIDYL